MGTRSVRRGLARAGRRALGEVIRDYRWIHTAIGILGNALFLAGSVSFLAGAKATGEWLFVLGASGMLVGSVGSALVGLASDPDGIDGGRS